jgi:hypothetical protein
MENATRSGLSGNNQKKILTPILPLFLLLTGCAEKTCDNVREDAVRLLETYQSCETDEVCAVYELFELVGENNCLETFQCSGTLNSTYDLAQFTESAKGLIADFSSCNMCIMADCVPLDMFESFCNTASGLCEIRPY